MAATRPDEAVEIREVPRITPEEATQLTGWGDNIFGTAHLQLTYRPKEGVLHFVIYADGHGPLSHAGVLKHHASANGRTALIGGIGGVVTIPTAQRRGYASMIVRHATDFLRSQWNVDFALLFCVDRMVKYYERLGWRTVACEVMIDQPAGKIPSPFHVMTMPFKPGFETIEQIDLGSAPW